MPLDPVHLKRLVVVTSGKSLVHLQLPSCAVNLLKEARLAQVTVCRVVRAAVWAGIPHGEVKLPDCWPTVCDERLLFLQHHEQDLLTDSTSSANFGDNLSG